MSYISAPPQVVPLTVPLGGSALTTVAAGSYLKGNDANALVPRTVAQVKTDLSLGALAYLDSITMIGARAYATDTGNIPDNAITLIPIVNETYDVGNNYDTVNSKFVAPSNGYYLIEGQASLYSCYAVNGYHLHIYKNAASICAEPTGNAATDKALAGIQIHNVQGIFYCAAGDEITLRIQVGNIGAGQGVQGGTNETHLTVVKIAT